MVALRRRKALGARAVQTAVADLARAVRLLAQTAMVGVDTDLSAMKRAEAMADEVLHRVEGRRSE